MAGSRNFLTHLFLSLIHILEDGKHELDGSRLYVSVVSIFGKEKKDCLLYTSAIGANLNTLMASDDWSIDLADPNKVLKRLNRKAIEVLSAPNVSILVALSTSIAFLFSLFNTDVYKRQAHIPVSNRFSPHLTEAFGCRCIFCVFR